MDLSVRQIALMCCVSLGSIRNWGSSRILTSGWSSFAKG